IEAQPYFWGAGDATDAMVDQYAAQQIRLAQAQAVSTGDEIVIAVLDSGVADEHPFFDGRVLEGYDFVDEDNDANDEMEGVDEDGDGDVDEAAGHGTHVAGIVSIVAPHAQILPVRIFNSDGQGTYTDLIEGIVYAVDQGADVINISGSGAEASPFLQMAIDYAEENGVLVVVAGGVNNLGFPASYDATIAVGASDTEDMILDFALFAEGVEAIYAPGESILSAFPGDEYRYWTGNSMATPFVAGLAALMSAVGECDDGCVRDLITQTATVIGDDEQSSHQRIDAYRAVVEAAFTGRNESGLQALYTFREGNGETVFDVSGVGAPLDLTIDDTSATMWMPEGGLALVEATMLNSADPAQKIINATQASEEITIEAWVVPGTYRQRGPARIVTMSEGGRHANVMIGQISKRIAARFRTTDTNNAGKPNLKSDNIFLSGLNHVVYSRDITGYETIFINGQLASSNVRTGSTSAWDTYQLVLGSELNGGKNWLGIYHLVAVYDHAFDADAVNDNFDAGSGIALGPVVRQFGEVDLPEQAAQRVEQNLQALYDFNASSGDTVPDVSGIGEPLDLIIADENAVNWLPDGGLSVATETIVRSANAATKLTDASRESGELTIEAWITPQDGVMSGPARIVTLSADKRNRSFTLSQAGRKVDVRLRTTETSDNGTSSVRSSAAFNTAERVHIVYTRDALGNVNIYRNGELMTSDTVRGTLTFWRDDMQFALAGEMDGSKAWLGDYHLVAIYNRALSADEVSHNHDANLLTLAP
ncbi:MAG: S8 family serine peptidase, partial [Candidatus Promineifilaceae bacterium]